MDLQISQFHMSLLTTVGQSLHWKKASTELAIHSCIRNLCTTSV